MIFDRIVEIICGKLDIDSDQIDMDSTFESLKIDSLDLVEIVLDVEDEFGIELDEADDLKSVGDLVKFIEENASDN